MGGGDQPLRGFRAWFVDPDERPVSLRSSGRRDLVWSPRSPMQAECIRREQTVVEGRLVRSTPLPACDEVPPALGCTCGVYAVAELSRLREMVGTLPFVPGGLFVLGEVEGWGRVIEHEDGWRATFVRPLALIEWVMDPVFDEVMSLLSQRYEIPRHGRPADILICRQRVPEKVEPKPQARRGWWARRLKGRPR